MNLKFPIIKVVKKRFKLLDKLTERQIVSILEEIEYVLADIEAGSGEIQPKHLRIKNALKKIKNLKKIDL